MRVFFSANRRAAAVFDSLLSPAIRHDGNHYFISQVIPSALKDNSVIYDIGGGSQPCISVADKLKKNITLVGLDISDEEMNKAPANIYDQKISADLTQYIGNGNADTIVCQAVLEHIEDNRAAARSLSTICKQHGIVYVFVPCKNAVYARLNVVLPERVKNWALELVQPGLTEHQGFPAYYNNCTPTEMKNLFLENGFEIIQIKTFWMSSYFGNFFPIHILWRTYQLLAWALIGDDAAETFILIAKKEAQ
jgi:2-polyprenyl-6-hydroxyphenyl methylase/3-demethylubiquinone-9 3-methyltransferase